MNTTREDMAEQHGVVDYQPRIEPEASVPQQQQVKGEKRKSRARRVFAALVALSLVAWGVVHVRGIGREATDDAQLEGHVTHMSSRVPGRIKAVLVREEQVVQPGDLLVELEADDYDARLKAAEGELGVARATLAAANAQLAIAEEETRGNLDQARAGVSQARSTADSTRSLVRQATADIAAAEANKKLAERELERSRNLASQGSISPADLEGRLAAFDTASAALERARAQLANATSNVFVASDGIGMAQGRLRTANTAPHRVALARANVDLCNARVLEAEAALQLARLNRSYVRVTSSIRGVVSRLAAEVGEMASPERPLLAIVGTDDVWVIANFKETQVTDMRPGMPASIHVDGYPGHPFRGHVEGLAGATGSRFALLPPDNASGNFIKVVQRVPVLVRLDGEIGVPLRPGMSVEATIDTRAR